ncbi:hypothetical protein MTO96_044904 [Rhipicephalus appendiculatus]
MGNKDINTFNGEVCINEELGKEAKGNNLDKLLSRTIAQCTSADTEIVWHIIDVQVGSIITKVKEDLDAPEVILPLTDLAEKT